MINAVVLSAGRGKRLTPLTDTHPKCLVRLNGRTLLEWQMRALCACGVTRVSVVTGFGAADVACALRTFGLPMEARAIFNPFYAVADNIGSCWAAADAFGADTVLINGDAVFEPAVLERVLAADGSDIAVTVSAKRDYDADDMKVRVCGDRLTRISKKLAGAVSGEAIGMIRFRRGGSARFLAALRAVLETTEGTGLWYLSVIDALAREGGVGVTRVDGLTWAELDFPVDLRAAEAAARVVAARLFADAPAVAL